VKPVAARYLRLVCRGNSVNTWNSIREVRANALAVPPKVTASGAVDGHEPGRAADGDLRTRWAANGRDHWIQFVLQETVPLEYLAIAWYEGDRRTYDVEARVSNDGATWTSVALRASGASRSTEDRLDVFERAGGRHRLLAVRYPVELPGRGVVRLTLTPIRGEAILCGTVLEPVEE
jgi:hypothetical protein